MIGGGPPVTEQDGDGVVLCANAFMGSRTVLTQQCVDYHCGENRNDKDVQARRASIKHIEHTLAVPFMIIHDPHGETRRDYLSWVVDPEISDSIHVVMVAVDIAPEPNCVVTWGLRSNLKKIDISKGVIYNASSSAED